MAIDMKATGMEKSKDWESTLMQMGGSTMGIGSMDKKEESA